MVMLGVWVLLVLLRAVLELRFLPKITPF